MQGLALPPQVAEPSSFETAEYRLNPAMVAAGASRAYARGITGAGVTVAVVDSLVSANGSELAGRVRGDGLDLTRPTAETDRFDHGTFVAGVIAGNRDGANAHGIAYGAQILPVRIFTGDGRFDPGQGSTFAGLTRINEFALQRGARVVNNSWGPSLRPRDPTDPPPFSRPADTAQDAARFEATALAAIQAGTVFVWSAGNDGLSTQLQGLSTLPLSVPALEAGWLVVMALDAQTGLRADFSNACGQTMNFCMGAVGTNFTGQFGTGQTAVARGTSFAAPMVSGALALLFQTWPQLSADQARRILFVTADDLGQPGVDPVYGHGGLNIGRAFTPVGVMSLAGSGQVLDGGSALVVGGPLGPTVALGLASHRLDILDSFGRDFSLPADTLVSGTAPGRQDRALAAIRGLGGLATGGFWAGPAGGGQYFFTPGADGIGDGGTRGVRLALGDRVLTVREGRGGSALADVAALDVGAPLPLADGGNPFLDLLGQGTGLSWRQGLGDGFSLSGTVAHVAEGWSRGTAGAATFAWDAGTDVALALSVGTVAERDGLLGLGLTGLFGDGLAQTDFLSAAARWQVSARFSLSADAHVGRARFSGGAGNLLAGAEVQVQAFGAAMALDNVLDGTLTAGVRQPLRATGGSLRFNLPGVEGPRPVAVDAAAEARGLDLALGWSTQGPEGRSLSLGLTYRLDADHQDGAEEAVMGLRWSRRF